MKVTVIIPARYASSRFPGKPLALISGKPMVWHVYERASKASLVDEVFVATEDHRVEECVKNFDGKVVMTSSNHQSGTDRMAEVAKNISSDIFINVQGDEPLISPDLIDQVASALINSEKTVMSTARIPFKTKEDFLNPNMVKVLCDQEGYALYFSRYPIPFLRKTWTETRNWNDLLGSYSLSHIEEAHVQKHLGIYGFKRQLLLNFSSWTPTSLEKMEELEQLRALEHGVKIKVVTTTHESVAVDTPEDLKKVNELFSPKHS
ncbi:MAG: hypothetical protein A2Z91_08575 [Deltaproteobacteria bacterium GWA2_38_16]|nr:MAG: hypothetical protein A2Z91_08575 [Deltaproteobacteria bacterium GWA2_38_16]OGQ03848.1 MAG: hypothetical protein A3D19_07140 [Deltaproteobacteria bacterium RIFCSPHIGHO2_02_FULL_38_15]OGQ31495.1 MAG: hypothetical protein A3A72_09170 [Deltaproteobacteria bacterium RIFCSPLOWO2_01_FULL_38_9]HBQ20894.1 3-deoxy-manno-octulosonate cytidylyltransferase [Deltaproteobacteria bacterium]